MLVNIVNSDLYKVNFKKYILRLRGWEICQKNG